MDIVARNTDSFTIQNTFIVAFRIILSHWPHSRTLCIIVTVETVVRTQGKRIGIIILFLIPVVILSATLTARLGTILTSIAMKANV
jgi:hypothetical protein